SEGVTPHSIITWYGNLTDVTANTVDIETLINVNAEVFIENVSNAEGVSPGLVGRLLVKYPGDKEFTVVSGKYIGEKGNNDEFMASFIANKPGKYEYKFEFTTKGTYGFKDKNSIKTTESKTFELALGDSLAPIESITLEKPEQQSGEVNLKWATTGTNNIALYEIVRDGNVIARIKDGSLTSYKDTDVTNKTEYEYKVIAYTNGGSSVASKPVTVTPDLVMVEVTFKLHAPSYTPLDAVITMPGAMNGWDVNSWEMSRNGAVTTVWSYTISVLEGETIEYKYVKGCSWDQEALMNYSNPKAANQSKYGCTTGEGGNEKVIVVNQGDGKMVVENEVIRWKDMPVVISDPSTGSYTKNETIVVKGNAMLDPNLTINGEQVEVDENGNFAHEVKLELGLNNIAVHIEPKEENINNPDLFNNNEEAIGFATKDLTLDITRLGEGEEMPEEPGEGEEEIVIVKTHLQIAVEEAEKISESNLKDIVPAVVKEFKAALEEAKVILAKEDATQEEINKSFDRLSKVMQMLSFKKGDKEQLILLVEKIESLKAEDYFEDTWNNVQVVLSKAKDVIANENAMEEEVASVYDELVRSFLNLRLKPNKDMLNDLINKAESLVSSDYTPETWNVLLQKLKSAKVVMKNDNATEEEVVKVEKELRSAIDGLIASSGNNSNNTSNNNNNSSEKIPQTGGTNTIYYIIIALILVAGGAYFTFKKKKVS
ncbi:LPXTG cell wall anchor domain-containing protein, partial [Clostridium sp.]